MRWLAATLVLLAATASLGAWIYLRDRQPNTWHPPERQLVDYDAHVVLSMIEGYHCAHGCAVTGLGRYRPGVWLVHMRLPTRRQCAEITLDRFTFSPQHGLTGVRFVGCDVA